MEQNSYQRWIKKRKYNCQTSLPNNWLALPRPIEPDDVKRLLRKRFTPRDKCMILMLLRTGMRICELLSLKLQDINIKERTVIIISGAKTGKGRVVYISNDAYKALRKWIKIRDSKRKHLFYSRCRESMSYETSRSSFIKCLRKAGLVRKG